MAKRRKQSGPGWTFQSADSPSEVVHRRSKPPEEHRIRISLEKRGKGKVVTVIGELELTREDMKALGKGLKAVCGVGGTQTPTTVELQGDQREGARQWLQSKGWGIRA